MKKEKQIELAKEFDDIYSIEYKSILYININYNFKKYGNEMFSFSI